MPRNITVTFDDGSTHVYQNAPDDVTPEQVSARASQEFGRAVTSLDGGRAQPQSIKPSDLLLPGFRQMYQAGAGAVRGFGSIGATLMAPIDAAGDAMAGRGLMDTNRQRRAGMDATLRDMGADTEGGMFQAGKLLAEGASVSGVGNVLAKGVSAIPGLAQRVPNLVTALRSGGMQAGTATGGKALALRAGAGAAVGGTAAGLINPEDAKTGAVVGGALPVFAKGAGMAGQKIGQAIRGDGVSPEVAALAKRAKELGIDIPADRLVNSKPLDAVASGLNYVPFSGRAATEAKMSTQLNQALSRTFGQDSSNVTQALRKADAVLGQQFDDFLLANTVKMDAQFLDDIADAANKATKELGSDGAKIIGAQVEEIAAKAATGEIDGKAAYNIKKTLDRIGNRNSPEAWYALELKKKLMEALNRSVGPDKAQGFGQLRQQYGNMLELQKLAKNGAEGEVSVARLANLKNINNPDLQELADIAAQFVKAREGQHGAMQRAVVGMGASATLGPAGLIAGSTAGRAANATLNSNYLRDMLVSGRPPNALQALTAPEIRQAAYRVAPLLPSDR